MLQVARLSSNLLGESAPLVADFIRSQQHTYGGFIDLDGSPDLYYSVFGSNALLSLQQDLPVASLTTYLQGFQSASELDFIHICCLARCLASIGSEPSPEFREALISELAMYRTPDGGYNGDEKAASFGTVYACYLALGAFQDLGLDLPEPERLIDCISSLRTPDGGFSNEASMTMGTTPTTAAAVDAFRVLGHPVDTEVGDWLLNRCHPEGGFFAMPQAPIPDLLSTAVTLHALSGMQVPLDRVKEPCLDFIDTLWTNKGGFYGNWMEDSLDCEYTFYALLALGHLSL